MFWQIKIQLRCAFLCRVNSIYVLMNIHIILLLVELRALGKALRYVPIRAVEMKAGTGNGVKRPR